MTTLENTCDDLQNLYGYVRWIHLWKLVDNEQYDNLQSQHNEYRDHIKVDYHRKKRIKWIELDDFALKRVTYDHPGITIAASYLARASIVRHIYFPSLG